MMASSLFDYIVYITRSDEIELINEFNSIDNGNSSTPMMVLEFDLIFKAIEAREEEVRQAGYCYPKQLQDDLRISNILEALPNIQMKDNQVPLYVIIVPQYGESDAENIASRINQFHPKAIIAELSQSHWDYENNF